MNKRTNEDIDKLRKVITEKTKEIKRLEKELEIAKIKSMKTTGMKRDKLEKIVQQSLKKPEKQLTKKIKFILDSHHKTPYEKKVDLFNLIKDLEVGESQPLKEQRINYLLESRLYDVLAKRALEDYQKTTVKAFTKAKQL